MKRELIWAPILGWYALRIGCVPVDRGKRGAAIARMMKACQGRPAKPGQLLIYPQGTRVAPGTANALQGGIGPALQPVGAGLRAGRHQRRRVLAAPRPLSASPALRWWSFLPRIKPGLGNAEFMRKLERSIETASDRLMAEAGFDPGRPDQR
jgi:1-acyl-sn-glycerol-3-phosphate acyltransferase